MAEDKREPKRVPQPKKHGLSNFFERTSFFNKTTTFMRNSGNYIAKFAGDTAKIIASDLHLGSWLTPVLTVFAAPFSLAITLLQDTYELYKTLKEKAIAECTTEIGIFMARAGFFALQVALLVGAFVAPAIAVTIITFATLGTTIYNHRRNVKKFEAELNQPQTESAKALLEHKLKISKARMNLSIQGLVTFFVATLAVLIPPLAPIAILSIVYGFYLATEAYRVHKENIRGLAALEAASVVSAPAAVSQVDAKAVPAAEPNLTITAATPVHQESKAASIISNKGPAPVVEDEHPGGSEVIVANRLHITGESLRSNPNIDPVTDIHQKAVSKEKDLKNSKEETASIIKNNAPHKKD